MKTLRNIIKIDEEKCIGCGHCTLACAEGAIALVDGKARVVSDIYCDGLGACIGTCPSGALSIEKREASPFNEEAAEKHLLMHNQAQVQSLGCPGSAAATLKMASPSGFGLKTLMQPEGSVFWPVKLRLINPQTPFLKNANLVLSADCSGFAAKNIHEIFKKIDNKVLLIACPKFEKSSEIISRLLDIFNTAKPKSLTILRMEVPCCNGLSVFSHEAIKQSEHKFEVKDLILSRSGEVVEDNKKQ